MQYVLEFDIMAFILSSITLVLFLMQRQISTRKTRFFRLILIFSILSGFFGFISSIAINNVTSSNYQIAYLTTFLYYLNHMSLPVFAYSFVLSLSELYPKKKIHKFFLSLPYIISVVILATNPLTQLFFYFTPSGQYGKGLGLPLLYGLSLIYLIAIAILIISNKVTFGFAIRNTIYLCLVLPITAIIIQNMIPGMVLESFSGSVSFMFLFITVQNKKLSMDPQTNFYTSEVFTLLANERIEKETDFFVIIIRSPDIAILQELFDFKHYSNFLNLFSSKLQAMASKGFEIFSLREGLFALIPKLTVNKSLVGTITIELINELEKIWTFESMKIETTIQITILQYPVDFSSYNDITDRIEQIAQFQRKIGNRHVFYGKDLKTNQIKYRMEIAKQLHESFHAKELDLNYQFIFSTKENKNIALEVSLYMQASNNTQIRQQDILNTAHQIGKSQLLSELMYEQAMKWFVREKVSTFGISKMYMELLEAQCIDANWGNRILDIAKKCNFGTSFLCLELSERVLHFNNSTMFKNMTLLQSHGVQFAIDGFGTDYSDMDMLIKAPIEMIKFDKELIKESISSEKGKKMILGCLSMFNQMGLLVVAEGVETIEQFNYLHTGGCTLFQGYHISKPKKEEQIIETLKSYFNKEKALK